MGALEDTFVVPTIEIVSVRPSPETTCLHDADDAFEGRVVKGSRLVVAVPEIERLRISVKANEVQGGPVPRSCTSPGP